MAWWLTLTLALAHHGTATSQVSPTVATAGSSPTATDALLLEAGMTYLGAAFDRIVQGRTRSTPDRPVAVHTLTARAVAHTPTGTSVGVAVPVGMVRTGPIDAVGLGDVAVNVDQRLVGGAGGWFVHGGLTAPTGRDGDGAAHSAMELTPLADGQLLVATYDSRASLSRGASTALLGTSVRLPVGPVRVGGRLDLQQPLHRTRDGILWGRDLGATTSVGHDPLEGLGVFIAGDGRWHGSDRGAFVDSESGAPLPQAVGKRRSVGATGGLRLALTQATACTATVRVPVWQRSESIVLMEGLSGTVACRIQAEAGGRGP